ncbi:hypothetical protein [Spirillospora sp. CA-294931]|uniref:hypothetical protein n=1 Tax=Spirillospora sp. CA-294931 TaxID=3240042 RepID=UPI003D8A570B
MFIDTSNGITMQERMVIWQALRELVEKYEARITEDARQFGLDFTCIKHDREDVKLAKSALDKL